MNNVYFNEWVANTVENISGIRPCFKGLRGECALTLLETRMGACQGSLDIYFDGNNVDFTQDTVIVTTNKRVLH